MEAEQHSVQYIASVRCGWRHRTSWLVALIALATLALPFMPATAPNGPLRILTAATSAARFSGDGVAAFGDAPSLGGFGGMSLAAPVVALARTPTGRGYWVAAADGGVFSFGDARFHGSMGGTSLFAPVVGAAATPDGGGYWLVAADGGVFSFGDARFYGSMGGTHLNAPIVAMAATPDGGGYWLVAADGGVFSFGDARFHGSMGGTRLTAPVAGIAATRDGLGYWLVGADGGVFTFGDARFYGSAADQNIGTWVTGMAATPDGAGYWLIAATGGVLSIGDATFYGPSPNRPPFTPTAAILATPDGQGYWLLQPDSINTLFDRPVAPPPTSGMASASGVAAVQLAASQIAPPAPGAGPFCNPYGPCEEWCSLFATWVWQRVGVAVPTLARVSDVFAWAGAHGLAVPATERPAPGDFVLYGASPAASVHMGIVAEVWPNGAITTIEGDSGPEPNGQFGVTFNGPYQPALASSLLGFPIYAFVQP
jgi:hypothetical protein